MLQEILLLVIVVSAFVYLFLLMDAADRVVAARSVHLSLKRGFAGVLQARHDWREKLAPQMIALLAGVFAGTAATFFVRFLDDLSYSGHLVAAMVWLALAVVGLLIALSLLVRTSNSSRGTWQSAGYLRWEADVLRQRILDGTISRPEGEEQLRKLRIRVQLWERTSRQQQLRVGGKKYAQVIDNRLDKVPRWTTVSANQLHPLRNQIRVEELLLGFPFRLGWPVWIAGVGPLALALLLLDAIGLDAMNLRVLVLALVVFMFLSAAGLGVVYVWLRAVRRLAVYSASVDKQEVFVLDEILDEVKITLQARGRRGLFRWWKSP